jgi:RNA polymerase sigma factor (sigma-70 family)
MQNFHDDIIRAQKGDLSAFDRIVTRFRDMAVGYGHSILRDFQLAEDAAQEAFIQAYQDLPKLNVPKAFPLWFRRIVFKHCDRIMRKRKPSRAPIETMNDMANHGDSPFETISKKDTQDAILKSVNSLPPQERTMTTLFYINGYSMADVGKFLDVPISTVKSSLYSARTRLKGRMIKMVRDSLQTYAPGEKFNQRVRKVLEKVPVVSFELHRGKREKGLRRCPEIVPFPSCLRACLEYLGDDMGYEKINVHNMDWRLDTTYVYLMGTTGAAFRLSFKPGWQADNSVIAYMSDDAEEPFRRGLESVGYDYQIIYREENKSNETYLRKRILESIRDKNRPVIARGVLGPPEECIIAGFDEKGDILIGWSFFQSPKKFTTDVEFESSGYFRKRNWYKDTSCVILLGEKKKPCPLSDVYRNSIQWALKVMGTARVHEDRYNGIAAYDAIAKEIQRDEEFTNKKVKELHHRYMVLQDALGPIGEGRWYAHHFLRKVIEDIPCPKEELSKAAECFNQEHTLMWKMWDLVGGPGMSAKKAKLFADHKIRKKTAQILLKARDKNQQGADHLDNALKAW